MATLRVLILGAGFGGLEAAARLSEGAPDRVDVTLIDQSDAFVFGFSKLDVMFGRSTLPHVRARYDAIRKPAVTFRRERVLAIDPVARRVVTGAGSHKADVLVVALGADLDPAATPGLVEGSHEFYSVEGAERLAGALPTFTEGHAVIGVIGTPYKCPPAPSETALMLDDFLSARGHRHDVRITVVSPLGTPVPPTSRAILDAFAERDITYLGGTTVTRLDPGRGSAVLHDGAELDVDLFLGVPLHRVPPVLADSGLCDGGWVGFDPRTLATSFPGSTPSAMWPTPRCRGQACSPRPPRVVVEQVLAEIRGGDISAYDGYGTCYIEFGGGRVARAEMTFITMSGPQGGPFVTPSMELAREKEDFASSRLRRWFGRRETALR
ncbi:MAG: NAD(P)/FAD-dependent oxidoreductase [Frankiaceae bacterium]